MYSTVTDNNNGGAALTVINNGVEYQFDVAYADKGWEIERCLQMPLAEVPTAVAQAAHDALEQATFTPEREW